MKRIIKFITIFILVVIALFIVSVLIFANHLKNYPSIEVVQPSEAPQSTDSTKPFKALNDVEKKQIHADIVAAEVKARKEAESQYETDPHKPNYSEDNIYKKHELQTSLQETYKLEVYQRYNISEDTAVLIVAQGIEEDWEVDFGY